MATVLKELEEVMASQRDLQPWELAITTAKEDFDEEEHIREKWAFVLFINTRVGFVDTRYVLLGLAL